LPTDGRCARLSIGAAAAQLRLSAACLQQPPAAANQRQNSFLSDGQLDFFGSRPSSIERPHFCTY
jgi:hypothetical protein